MGAMAPPPHWSPVDDLVLKNAVEGGASLESLAKGAVQFTRRYAIHEIQERWFSLLYDPVVSSEASSNMTELELSGFTNQPKPPNKFEPAKEMMTSSSAPCSSSKRRSETIRKCYYSMRKRICNEPFDLTGLNLLPDPTNSNLVGPISDELGIQEPVFDIPDPISNGLGIQETNFVMREPISNEFGIQEPEFDTNYFSDLVGLHPYPYEENIPLGGPHIEAHGGFDQSNELPLPGLYNDLANAEFMGNNFEPQIPIWNDSRVIHIGEEENPDPELRNVFYANITNTLFEDFPTDANNAIDDSYIDHFSAVLLNSPIQNEVSSADPGESVVAADVAAAPVGPDDCGSHQFKVLEAEVACHVLEVKNLGPEYRNGVICCTLNTEDTDVPSNDDVFLPFRFPSSPTGSCGAHWSLEDPSYFVSTSSVAPRKIKNHQKKSKNPNSQQGVKFELPKSNVQSAAFRNSRNGELSAKNICSGNVSGNNFVMKMDGAQQNLDYGPCVDKPGNMDILENFQTNAKIGFDDVKAEILNDGLLNADLTCQTAIAPHQTNENPMLSDEEDRSENEFHVPYFSDVEAMVVDMDLTPDEFNIDAHPEVCRYNHEESRRTIIRLEQTANACTQRAISAQGAFAVLYGRCSKYYIQKPEVLIGRATEDNRVDIDLGREKNGGKISRRQAIIKMDMYGTFQMKNLGRYPIFVNGREVAAEQSIPLISGCIIEVRGLCFLFETNHSRIKQHLDSVMNGRFLVNP
ncbi:hypothetical protein ABFS83_03G071900 [Erythranthe nasuta]